MSFKIERGLFTSEFTDYHAILGVSVDAELKDIRKRYLKIARRLHPDSLTSATEGDRQRASELLSKLVNPAYEKLSQEKAYSEYCVLLKLKGKQALKQQETVILTSEPARKLASTHHTEQTYNQLLRELADELYQSLDATPDLIGQVSELNLVYLMRKDGPGNPSISSRAKSPRPATNAGQNPTPSSPPRTTAADLTASYLRRAEEYESKQDYSKAILEIREALRMQPKNGNLHTRLGIIYIKANQLTMAKIHFNQALKINPQDKVAEEGLRRVDPQRQPSSAQKSVSNTSKSAKSGGGLFGLFGGKKK
ncbi:MAG: tetratricopeptide repeat protein [Elainellaceae cyanobacterium]